MFIAMASFHNNVIGSLISGNDKYLLYSLWLEWKCFATCQGTINTNIVLQYNSKKLAFAAHKFIGIHLGK